MFDTNEGKRHIKRQKNLYLPATSGMRAHGLKKAEDIAADFPRHRVFYSPESGSKITRAEAPAAQAEAGNVYIVRGAWNGEFLLELCAFPGGAFADQVDAFSRAYHRAVRQPGRPISGAIRGAH